MRTLLFLFLIGALAPASGAHAAVAETEPAASPAPYTGKKFYTFEARFGSKGSSPDRLDSPEDVKVLPDGRLLIADTGNHRVLVWGPNGEPLAAYGSFGTSATWRNPPQFHSPSALLAHPSKKIFVADTLNHRIVVLDENGLVNSTWGTFGTDPTFLNEPLGMALNHLSQAIVADTGNFRMQVFTELGEPVTFQGWFGEGPYQFKEPAGVALLCNGMIAVTDSVLGRVQFLNNRFEFAGQWAAKDGMADAPAKPRFRGVTCDEYGYLYLADAGNHCIVKLKPILSDAAAVTFKPTPTPAETDPYGGMGFPIR